MDFFDDSLLPEHILLATELLESAQCDQISVVKRLHELGKEVYESHRALWILNLRSTILIDLHKTLALQVLNDTLVAFVALMVALVLEEILQDIKGLVNGFKQKWLVAAILTHHVQQELRVVALKHEGRNQTHAVVG